YCSREGRDDAAWAHNPYAGIARVGDVHAAVGADRDIEWGLNTGVYRGHVIAGETEFPVTCNRRDHALRSDLANPGITEIGHIYIARCIHFHAEGVGELSIRGFTSVAGETCYAIARDGGHRAARTHHLNDVSEGDMKIA